MVSREAGRGKKYEVAPVGHTLSLHDALPILNTMSVMRDGPNSGMRKAMGMRGIEA